MYLTPDEFRAMARDFRQSAFRLEARQIDILRTPLTDYQRYSLAWAIPDSVAAGMEYRVIEIADREVGLPDLDFWLYDDVTVVVLDFYEDDSPKGAELIESDIDQFRRWRDIALKESIPFREYRA